MAFTKVDDVMIPIFDGTDYVNWKKRILKFFELKKCKNVATREKTVNDKEETWNEEDVKAMNFIYSSITNKQLEYIGDLDSAYKIMKKFDEMYLKESTALQIVCRNNIENIKLKDFTDVTSFFDEFEKATNELKAAGGKITEQEKLSYMLKALPSSHSYIGDLIDILPKEERTVEYLKSKIKLKSAEEKRSREQNSNAFYMEMRGKCYTCGKAGHKQVECPQGAAQGQEHGRGHGQSRGNYQRSYSRGYQRRGYSRGRSSNRGASNVTRNHQGQHNTQGNAFITEVHTSQVNNKENKVGYKNHINWILDSGCTDHIVNDDTVFDEYVTLDRPVEVKLGDGRMLKATKIGRIKAIFPVYENNVEITLYNVFYVKDMKQNLISYSKVTHKNKIVSCGNESRIYNQNRELIAIAKKEGNLYHMTSYVINNQDKNVSVSVAKNVNMTMKEKWHRTLGHVNFNYLNKLCKNELLIGLPKELETEYVKCATCIESKMSNLPFENSRTKAKEILEIVHTDINGPHPTAGNCGEKYFLTFIDDYSKLAKVYCIATKSETYNCFVDYVNSVENLTDKRVKNLVCDNGKEYMNTNVYNFIRDKGIRILPCPPYVHELNGVAERYNRSIMDMARCLLKEAKVNRMFWPEVVKASAYLKNRTLANTIVKKSPYEIFFNEKPNGKYLKIYGSRVFVRTPEALRKTKWDDKARLGVLLGYTETGYRILIDNKIINARHVDVVEEGIKYIGLSDNKDDVEVDEIDKNENENHQSQKFEQDEEPEGITEATSSKLETKESEVRHSSRTQKPNSKYINDDYVTNFIYVNYCDANVPNTFEEAIESHESESWKIAMNSEMESLTKNKTWKLVERPKDKKTLDVKWVYKKKDENQYKARLVVKGFQQKDQLENVYSPVVKMQTLKILLCYCCQNNLQIDQMDVETAFLNGQIISEVYVDQPEGYRKGTNKVYKLLKSLYGLKESPRTWYECFNDFMTELNFKRSNHDYCLFVNHNEKDPIYVLLFVDDMLICCKNQQKINNIKQKLSERFIMKDLGKVKTYIGIDIEHNTEKNIMTLSQTKYIESLGRKYNLENTKLYNTPMEVNLQLEPDQEIDKRIKYRNLIGELLYISTGTRPDIAYSVNYLSRYQTCYNETHYKYALRVLKYLYRTKDLKLTYTKNTETEVMDCMVDADWAGDCNDRKSTTGYVIRIYDNTIYWKSHKQKTVTKSSTFAEYVALSEAVTDVNFVKEMLKETFHIDNIEPINIFEDNSGALAIAKYGNLTKNSKHIEVQYHYVNENYEKGIINIIKIDSANNIADILTKSLCKAKLEKCRDMFKLL